MSKNDEHVSLRTSLRMREQLADLRGWLDCNTSEVLTLSLSALHERTAEKVRNRVKDNKLLVDSLVLRENAAHDTALVVEVDFSAEERYTPSCYCKGTAHPHPRGALGLFVGMGRCTHAPGPAERKVG